MTQSTSKASGNDCYIKPFSIVNVRGFLNYSKRLDPRFILKATVNLQQNLSEAQSASVSIQIDGWSQHPHQYTCIMANYINKDLKRAKAVKEKTQCANKMDLFFPNVAKISPFSASYT